MPSAVENVLKMIKDQEVQYVSLQFGDMFELSRASETDANGNGPQDAERGFGSIVDGQDDGGRLARTIG